MTTLEASFKDYIKLFEQTMEMWTLVQEDTHLQKIVVDIHEKQLQFDEIRATVKTLAHVQRFNRLQEGNFIQTQIDEFHWKASIVSSTTQSLADEECHLSQTVQTKRTMGLAVEGLTTEKPVKEFHQATVQRTTNLQ